MAPGIAAAAAVGVLTLGFIASSASARAADAVETQRFLKGQTHSYLPYPFPDETSFEELQKVIGVGADAVGVFFVGRYNGGNIDFSKLDEAIRLIDAAGSRAMVHLAPRFGPDEGVRDTISSGAVLQHAHNKSPGYSIIDIFDPGQRRKFFDYISLAGKRYGGDRRVCGFVVGWGYMAETGFYMGDFLSDFSKQGAEAAGYSSFAKAEFNRWRNRMGLAPADRLPLPGKGEQSDDYICFMRFRSEFVRDVFQKGYIGAMKQHTAKPVGTFGYIAAGPESYSRNWTSTPNADFYRTAGSASSHDMTRTLIDSAVGWEDSGFHDGGWDFSFGCMKRDEQRQLARGGAFHIMWYRGYETEPNWEPGIFGKISGFLMQPELSRRQKPPRAEVAVFVPTWGVASVPGRSPEQPFVPDPRFANYFSKMTGLAESFGLRYRIVTEWELLDADSLEEYDHIIISLWDRMERIIGREAQARLASDKRVIGIDTMERPLTRSEYRELLRKGGVPTTLDYDADNVLAGRTGDLVYNFSGKSLTVIVPDAKGSLTLDPHETRRTGR